LTGCCRFSTTHVAFHRRAFASRVPVLGIGHSLAFALLSPCEVDDVLGMDATPDTSRLNQCPLAASLQRQAPRSPHQVSLDFPLLSQLSADRFHLTVPDAQTGPFTCFRFATPCEVGDILGMDATPDSFRPNQSPLAAYRLRQAPLTIATARCRGGF
jgi:hypothetical protein